MSKVEEWREREGLGTPEIIKQDKEKKEIRNYGKNGDGAMKGAGTNTINTASGVIPEGPYLMEKITGGDSCIEEEVAKMEVNRTATIKYYCGAKVQLINVEETRSCHYELSVTVPGLCNREGWRREKERKRIIKCTVEREDEGKKREIEMVKGGGGRKE